MTETCYPNESAPYRVAREALLAEEKALVEKVKPVAEQRRKLPLGGRIKEDYVFIWASDNKLGQRVKISQLFGDGWKPSRYGVALLEPDGLYPRRQTGSSDSTAGVSLQVLGRELFI